MYKLPLLFIVKFLFCLVYPWTRRTRSWKHFGMKRSLKLVLLRCENDYLFILVQVWVLVGKIHCIAVEVQWKLPWPTERLYADIYKKFLATNIRFCFSFFLLFCIAIGNLFPLRSRSIRPPCPQWCAWKGELELQTISIFVCARENKRYQFFFLFSSNLV